MRSALLSCRSFRSVAALGVSALVFAVSGCSAVVKPGDAYYWQRVEAHSQLYLTGPKAQQQLEGDIAGCVRELDELVRIGALRDTTPPDTYSEYRKALDASGDLAHWETPTRLGSHRVDHTDYHDFESCMVARGWERAKFVPYQLTAKANKTYTATQEIRRYGVSGPAAKAVAEQQRKEAVADYQEFNE